MARPESPPYRYECAKLCEPSRLLDEPVGSGAELFAAACELRDSFVRSEHQIGLPPPDAAALLVAGLERAGAAGVVDAWLELGRLPAYGAAPSTPYPEQDIDRSIAAYREADRAGSRDGAVGWIKIAYYSRDTEYESAAAQRLEQLRAANPDDPELLMLTGYLLHQGYGHAPDADAAARHHRAAAERGHADAAFELSVLYTIGSGGRRGSGRGAAVDPTRPPRSAGTPGPPTPGTQRPPTQPE